MTIPQRLQKMLSPTPHGRRGDGVSLEGHSLWLEALLWFCSKLTNFTPVLATVQTSSGCRAAAAPPLSLLSVSPPFSTALDSQPQRIRRRNAASGRGITLSRGDLLQKIPKVDLVGRDSKEGWGFSKKHNENQQGFWLKEQFQLIKYRLKNKIRIWAKVRDTLDSLSPFPSFYSFFFFFLTINFKRQASNCPNYFPPAPPSPSTKILL